MEFNVSHKMEHLKASVIREFFKYAGDPEIISFAAGDPAPECLPKEMLTEIFKTVMARDPNACLMYSQSEGYPPLRLKVKEFLKERYAIGTDRDQLLVLTGAQQGMDLVSKVFINEGDRVICEQPSFIGSLNCFRSYGAQLLGVEMEADGINLEGLELALQTTPKPKLIYVIPNFQNPSGITMSLSKRQGVYALAKAYGVPILEDNPYGDLRFQGAALPEIKSMDTEGLVFYVGTFSKILAPGLRVGYLLAPEENFGKITVAKQCTDVHTAMITQLACLEFLTHYNVEAHIDSFKSVYKEKCHLMLAEMDKHFPKEVSYTRPEGGLFIWATLPPHLDGKELSNRLVKEEKVLAVPGAAFMTDSDAKDNHLRFNFSKPTTEQIKKAIPLVGALLHKAVQEDDYGRK